MILLFGAKRPNHLLYFIVPINGIKKPMCFKRPGTNRNSSLAYTHNARQEANKKDVKIYKAAG